MVCCDVIGGGDECRIGWHEGRDFFLASLGIQLDSRQAGAVGPTYRVALPSSFFFIFRRS